MIVAIHQLHYLPWLRYLHKIASCDLFVILDDCQFNKNGWQNRNKIKGAAGAQFLTVPVRHKMGQRLHEVRIDNATSWRRKHWQSLVTCYGKAPFFAQFEAALWDVYRSEWDKLNALNMALLALLLDALGLRTKCVLSSTLGIPSEATQRLVDIGKSLGATAYVTGEFAAGQYLETELFDSAGMELLFQKYQSPIYRQQFPRAGFVPDMSIVDLLFNHGPESLNILMGKAHADSSLTAHAR